jgi:hypothetical protein
MSTTTPTPLQTAAAKAADIALRHDAARADLEAADASVAGAWTAYRTIVTDGGEVSAAQEAIERTERAQRFARDRAEHLAKATVAAREAQHAAWIESHREAWDEGVRVRVAAAVMADDARATLLRAEVEAQRGAAILHRARAAGFGGTDTDASRFAFAIGELRTAQHEALIWAELND